jgi:hypothetical protein
MMASYVGVDGFTVELLVDVRPERSSSRKAHTDEHSDAARRPVFVVGISGTKPKTRAFVTERTWADQTKSAFSDGRVDSSIKTALQSAEAGTTRATDYSNHTGLTYLCERWSPARKCLIRAPVSASAVELGEII